MPSEKGPPAFAPRGEGAAEFTQGPPRFRPRKDPKDFEPSWVLHGFFFLCFFALVVYFANSKARQPTLLPQHLFECLPDGKFTLKRQGRVERRFAICLRECLSSPDCVQGSLTNLRMTAPIGDNDPEERAEDGVDEAAKNRNERSHAKEAAPADGEPNAQSDSPDVSTCLDASSGRARAGGGGSDRVHRRGMHRLSTVGPLSLHGRRRRSFSPPAPCQTSAKMCSLRCWQLFLPRWTRPHGPQKKIDNK